MKLIPLLFSTPMAKANMVNLKSQTRRTRGLDEINKNPDHWELSSITTRTDIGKIIAVFAFDIAVGAETIECPYGSVGDIIWQRETFAPNCFTNGDADYKADWNKSTTWKALQFKWRPSIHMPLAACRYFAQITEIRLERLSDITEADAQAEGITEPEAFAYGNPVLKSYVNAYFHLWNSINGPGTAAQNPWVWVVKYRRLNKPQALELSKELIKQLPLVNAQKTIPDFVKAINNLPAFP